MLLVLQCRNPPTEYNKGNTVNGYLKTCAESKNKYRSAKTITNPLRTLINQTSFVSIIVRNIDGWVWITDTKPTTTIIDWSCYQ